jgi:hypothetical protein
LPKRPFGLLLGKILPTRSQDSAGHPLQELLWAGPSKWHNSLSFPLLSADPGTRYLRVLGEMRVSPGF